MKFLVLLSLIVSVNAVTENPLSRVIGLIDDLAAKINADGEREAKAFEEFRDWCKNAAQNSKHEIETLTSNKEKLEADISELAGRIESHTSKIEDLSGAIAGAEAELKEATGVRAKEAADFAASEKELVEVVDTLDRAIGVLEREFAKNPAALSQISSKATNLVQSLSIVADAASLNVADKKTLLGFAQMRQSTSDADDDEAPGAPAAAVYKSQSGNIIDVLEDLKEKAEAELSDLRKAETNAKHNFQMLKQSLEDQLDADNADHVKTTNAKASAEEGKAAAEGDHTATVASLKTVNEKLDTANSNCMTVAADHEATVAARNEELRVIAEAKQILHDTSAGAVKESYSFVQTRSDRMRVRTRADLINSEVVASLKNLATKQHSAALAQLASRVSAVMKFGAGNGDDPFKKVRGLIRNMIDKLEKEANEDATEKAYCDEELKKSNAKKDSLTSTVEQITAKIDKTAARSAQLKEDVKSLQSALADLSKEQAEMNKIRKESHDSYTEAKANLELGLSGVRQALNVLREYYQGSADAAALMQQPAMPEHHGKSTGAGQSIIGILEVCESDFATDLAKEETAEADAQASYEKTTQENEIEKTSKEQDVKYKTKEFKEADKTVAELSADRSGTQEELSAVSEYLSKIESRCIAKPESYESRKARRAAEIQGLKEALDILETQTASLLQKKGHLRGGAIMA